MLIQDAPGIYSKQPDLHSRDKVGDLFGIEIETENFKYEVYNDCDTNLRNRINTYWDIGHDGSLRNNGVEFRLLNASDIVDVRSALVSFYDVAKIMELDFSFRCGIHVHIDLRDLHLERLKYFVESYIKIEPFLIKYIPHVRTGNPFCQTCTDRSANMYFFSRILNDKEIDPDEEGNKYGSLNLTNLFSFGSAEFRMLDGNASKDTILDICKHLSFMKGLAMNSTVISYDDILCTFNLRNNTENRKLFNGGCKDYLLIKILCGERP